MTELNRQWLLAARPHGMVKESDFRWHEAPLPAPGEGDVLVRVLYQIGLENAPRTLLRLFRGENRGKQLLEIA